MRSRWPALTSVWRRLGGKRKGDISKCQLLEEEAEESDKHLREANERYVSPIFILFCFVWHLLISPFLFPPSLRQTDVKAGHLEPKVQALEVERDSWEKKYEDMAKKFQDVQKELEDFQNTLSDI